MSDDVGKQWNDRPEIRRATRYSVTVMAAAVTVMALAAFWAYLGRSNCVDASTVVCAPVDRYVLAIAPAAILMIGGLGAFVHTYTVWRRNGTWPVWQGAGWLLMTFMLIYSAMGAGLLAE